VPNDPQNITALVLTIWRFTWMRRELSNSKDRRLTRCFSVINHLLLQQHKYRQTNAQSQRHIQKQSFQQQYIRQNVPSGTLQHLHRHYSCYQPDEPCLVMENLQWLMLMPKILCLHLPEHLHCTLHSGSKQKRCCSLFKALFENDRTGLCHL